MEPLRLPLLIGALAAGVAAFLVLYVRPTGRVNRALALFLAARALFSGLSWYDTTILSITGRLTAYVVLAIPFAALNAAYLLVREDAQSGGARTAERRLVRWSILVVWIVIEAIYLLDHAMYVDQNLNDGPLGLFSPGFLTVSALIGLAAAHKWRNEPQGDRARGWFLISLGFLVEPAIASGIHVPTWLTNPQAGAGLAILDLAIQMATTTVVLITIPLFGWPRHGQSDVGKPSNQERTATWTVVAALVNGALVYLGFQTWPPANAVTFLWLSGAFWTIIMALLLSFAVVRYRVLNAERRFRFAIKQSTFAAIVGAIFILASETLELLIDAEDSTIAIAVAVGLATLFRMLQRLSGMLAARLMPFTDDGAHAEARKYEVYEAALENILVDGDVTDRERLVLDTLVEKLELDPERVRSLEDELTVRFARSG